ncbi:hypothetical protein ABPG74_001928 [Tetrahymena malaccensis]
MMNFIPSKIGHEELESQSKQSTKSFSNLNLPQSSTYLNNIRGDEDSNEGHLSDGDEFQDNEHCLNQYQQNYIMDQQNMQYNSYPYQHYQNENYHNKGYQGQVRQVISPKAQQSKFLGHTQSLSMKENLPQRNYGVAKSSTSPFRGKLGKEQKENQHLQQQQRSSNSTSNIKSFEKSYQELTQQILSQRLENVQQNDYSLRPQDLLLGQQQLQELQKRKHYDQKTQEELFKRLNKEAELQNDYKHQLALEQQKKEMEQCTFTPQTYSTRPEEQRTLNQFLEDQEKFQKQQSEKINMLRYQIQEEKNQNTTHQPKINQKSEMIVQMKRVEKEPVYDRLYKISQEKSNRTSDVRTSNQINGLNCGTTKFSSRNSNIQLNQTQRASEYELELEQQNTFQPQINEKSKMMVRKGKVGDHLYQDALRRQEKINTIQSQQESVMTKQQKSTMSNQTNRIISSRSEQIVATKFVREFESVCDEILHDPNSQKIDYLQMGEILNRLHFLKNVGDESNLNNLGHERKLVYDIWYNLRGDELGGVTKCNLCQFLLIVIGIFSFQLQTEDQIRQMQNEQNQNNGNVNFAHPLQNDSYNKYNQQPNTLYLQERYTEEEDEDYDPQNPYYHQDQQKLMQLTVQQQLNEFNQGNDSFQAKLQQFNQKNRKGFIDQIGNWNIPVDEAKCLQKEFDILYRNRLSNEELKKTDFKQDSTFQPQINQNSKKLAENYREKLLEETANLISNQEIQVKVPPSGKITHVDLLVFQKQAQLQERQKKNQAQNLAVQQSCTFHPQTLPSSSSLVSKSNLNNQSGQMNNNGSNASLMSNQCGLKKSNQLYQLAKLKNGKKDKDKNEIEYEKNFDECTFQPDIAITRSKSSNALRKSHVSAVSVTSQRDSDKYIERMRAANKQREEKNIMLQRGYNKPDGNDKKKSEKAAPVSSRLYNDVPLYRQSKQNNTNEQQQSTSENQNTSEQIQQYGEASQTQEYSQYQQYMMNQKQTEQSYDNFMNNQQDSYGLYSYNQEGEDTQHQAEQHNQKVSDNQSQQFQYNQIQPINPLEKVPLLFVDVNLGREKTERIIVFEGDTSEALATKFAEEQNLDSQMKQKLKELLDNQIAGLLTKIDEEEAPSMMSD